MSFDFSGQEMLDGHLVEMVLDMLPGAPVVHLEHLGHANKSYVAAQIAHTNAVLDRVKKSKTPKRKTSDGEEVLRVLREQPSDTAQKREDLLHAIRHLEATHTDGTPATDADIPAFIAAIPTSVVLLLWTFANRERNFYRELPDAAETAKK